MMRLSLWLLSVLLVASNIEACPYLSHRIYRAGITLPEGHPPVPSWSTSTDADLDTTPIGPDCTQLAHNDYLPPSGQCTPDTNPPMYGPTLRDYNDSQPAPTHEWPTFFQLDWTMTFINDFSVLPPYDTAPPTKSVTRMTRGRTWYDSTLDGGMGAQREYYADSCIAIFPEGPLSSNNFSCDFIARASLKIAYLVLHEDRPTGAPECCIIGQPFHQPPRNFWKNMYLHKWSQQNTDQVTVDWGGLTLPGAGLFMYGFKTTPFEYLINGTLLTTSEPYAFYMTGVPFEGASWQYQRFANFAPWQQPSADTWNLPASCNTAVVCPGWS